MSFLNNVFIGIPLPKDLLIRYRAYLSNLKEIYPTAKLNNSENIHITILFLGRQVVNNIGLIEKSVADHSSVLKDCHLELSELGYFNNAHYDVLHLKVKQNKKLIEFFNLIKTDLNHLFLSEKNSFSPHLTLARINNQDRGSMSGTALLADVSWNFPVEVINIYGRDENLKNRQIILANKSM